MPENVIIKANEVGKIAKNKSSFTVWHLLFVIDMFLLHIEYTNEPVNSKHLIISNCSLV